LVASQDETKGQYRESNIVESKEVTTGVLGGFMSKLDAPIS
jgi:hypothetical protein